MASIRAVLELNDYGMGTLSRISSSRLFTNVSLNGTSYEIKMLSESLTNMTKNDGAISKMIMGDKDTQISKTDSNQKLLYQDKKGYNGYMWGLTDKNGDLKCDLQFYGVNMGEIIIYFDKTANQFPIEYSVTYNDGSTKSFTNKTSTEIIVAFKSGADLSKAQTVTFTKWNKANTNASITFIEAIPAKLNMNKQWIQNLDTTAQSVSNNSNIEYGCLSNTGSISLKDIDDKLMKYAELGYLDSNAFRLSLYFNNKLMQTHISTNSPYYSNNYTYDINLSNDIKLWDNIEIQEREYTSEITLYELLDFVMNEGNIKIDLSKTILVEEKTEISVETYLKSINIYATTLKPFKLNSDTLRNQLDKICTVAQLNIFQDDNGNFIAISARPRATDEELKDYLVVKNSMQYQRPVSTILVSNRYDGVIIK